MTCALAVSGSPVLAVSCTSGDYELVGIYHAVYKLGSALNVAVCTDEFRELITTLQFTTKRNHEEDMTKEDRKTFVDALQRRIRP